MSACLASLRNFGNRIASVFERKKKDVVEVAEEDKEKVEDVVEEQLKKTAEILKGTKGELENTAKTTGKKRVIIFKFVKMQITLF